MTNGKCFFAAPIGKINSPERERYLNLCEMLRTLCDTKDIELTLIDPLRMTTSGEITTQVVEQLKSAEYCIVDITGSNPNVMYELGIRTGIDRPYTVICEEGADRPFDLLTHRTMFYDFSKPAGIFQFQRDLVKQIKEHLQELAAQTKAA